MTVNKSYGFVTLLIGCLVLLNSCGGRVGESNTTHDSVTADLILENGAIYTVDPTAEWADAIAIKNGRIIAVGSNHDVSAFKGTETRVRDLGGRMVMPGIADTHIHVESTAKDSQTCVLPGTFESPDEQDLTEAIEACAKRFADHEILMGYRFATSAVPEGRMNRHWLDAIIADRPVVIFDESGHNVLLNSKALALTDITKETPSPEGGVIHRDVNGEATGYLQSTARQFLADLQGPELTQEDHFNGMTWSLRELTRKGVTAAMNATTSKENLPLWKSVLSQDGLVVPRMHLCHWVGNNTEPLPRAAELQAAWQAQSFPDDVKECAKIYGDNVLEAGQAALLDNYADLDHAGVLNFSQAELDAIVSELDAAGIQIKTHAIGDKTNRVVLNTYEKVIRARGGNPLRHHLGHLTVVHPDDWSRMEALDVPGEVIGTISALLPYVKISYYDTLGHERFEERVHPIGGIVDAGGIVNASSDWGAGILDPFRSIQTVITRKDPNAPETPAAGLHHAVDLPTAIRLHTINGQYILNRDKEAGTLEVGKLADLIVLDQNLFEIPVEDIRNTKVLLTLIGGETAWRADSFN